MHNIRLAPAIGQQSDDKFNGQPSSTDDGLAGENRRIKDNRRFIGHGTMPSLADHCFQVEVVWPYSHARLSTVFSYVAPGTVMFHLTVQL